MTIKLPRKVVGVVGPSGSGKTVVTDYLVNKLGFLRLHAAIAVKAAGKGFGLTDDEVDGDLRDVPSDKLGGVKPRIVLEQIGAAVQTYAPNATAIYWHSVVDVLPPSIDRIFMDGIRRQPEADAVHSYGGIVIRLTHPQNKINPEFPCDTFQLDVKEDVTVVNDGTLEELVRKFASVVNDFQDNGWMWG